MANQQHRLLRSQAPDVVVVVGKGENAQDFPCYRLFLSYASNYFDEVFTQRNGNIINNNRIELKDKDPEEWKLFYSFVDPATIRTAQITPDNVEVLIRWFHSFEMNQLSLLMKECDPVLATKIQKERTHAKEWFRAATEEENVNYMENLLSVFDMALVRNLIQTQTVVKTLIAAFVKRAYGSLSPQTIAKIVPYLKDHDSDRIILNEFQNLLPDNVGVSNIMSLVQNGSFPSLIYSGIQNKKEKEINAFLSNISQTVEFSLDEDKLEDLMQFLRTTMERGRTLIFADSNLTCDHVAEELVQNKLPAYALYKGKQKKERNKALEAYKDGGTMVVTDGYRGRSDIPKADMVISYDLPNSIEVYVKRLELHALRGDEEEEETTSDPANDNGKTAATAHTLMGQWDSEIASPFRDLLSKHGQEVPTWLHEMVCR